MNQVWLGIAGALLGAGVGGGIAHLNAWRFAKRQEKRQIEQEMRREKTERLGLAFSIVFKVQRATEIVTQVRKHVRKGSTIAAENNWPLWQGLMPFFGTDGSERLSFLSSELALFAIHNDAEYANDLQELATLYNLIVDLLREYKSRRDRFGEKATQNGSVAVRGQVASFESADRALPLLVLELDQYATSIARTVEDGAPDAIKIANAVCEKLRAHLDDKRFTVNLGYPEEPAPA